MLCVILEAKHQNMCCVCCWCGTAKAKEMIFMRGKTARRKHEILETSCVKDVRTRTYVSNGLTL